MKPLVKPALGWTGSWLLYWMGHVACKIMQRIDSHDEHEEWGRTRLAAFDMFWEMYQGFMSMSDRLQSWGGGFGPWRKVTVDETDYEGV